MSISSNKVLWVATFSARLTSYFITNAFCSCEISSIFLCNSLSFSTSFSTFFFNLFVYTRLIAEIIVLPLAAALARAPPTRRMKLTLIIPRFFYVIGF